MKRLEVVYLDDNETSHVVQFSRLWFGRWYARCNCGQWTGYSKSEEKLRTRSLLHMLNMDANT